MNNKINNHINNDINNDINNHINNHINNDINETISSQYIREKILYEKKNLGKNIVTFIIPTIGRSSLLNSINSLLNQTVEEWKAIIIFDGIKKNMNISDNRIRIIEIDKLGKNINSAGNVRNFGMSLVETEWIAFLDDDDIIEDDYLECFYKELKLDNSISVIIFRMKMENRIIPNLDCTNFHICDVGISFIINKNIYDNNLKFIPDGAEDYLYLDLIRKNGYKMVISPYTKYYVRANDYENISHLPLGRRIYINNNYLKLLFCFMNSIKINIM